MGLRGVRTSISDCPDGWMSTVAVFSPRDSTVAVHWTILPRLSLIIIPSEPKMSASEKTSPGLPVSLPLSRAASPSASMILTHAVSGSVLTRLSNGFPLFSSWCSTRMPCPGRAASKPISPLKVTHRVSPGAISIDRGRPPADTGDISKLPPTSGFTEMER